MAKHVLVVLSNATDGADEEFNRWYNGVHIPDVLKVKGFAAAQRFRIADAQMGPAATPYGYLALYEVETDDLAATASALSSGAGEMVISPTLDMGKTVAWMYTPVAERVTAKPA
jgi:hypothetical protein